MVLCAIKELDIVLQHALVLLPHQCVIVRTLAANVTQRADSTNAQPVHAHINPIASTNHP